MNKSSIVRMSYTKVTHHLDVSGSADEVRTLIRALWLNHCSIGVKATYQCLDKYGLEADGTGDKFTLLVTVGYVRMVARGDVVKDFHTILSMSLGMIAVYTHWPKVTVKKTTFVRGGSVPSSLAGCVDQLTHFKAEKSFVKPINEYSFTYGSACANLGRAMMIDNADRSVADRVRMMTEAHMEARIATGKIAVPVDGDDALYYDEEQQEVIDVDVKDV